MINPELKSSEMKGGDKGEFPMVVNGATKKAV
jgi:hypothetical protein